MAPRDKTACQTFPCKGKICISSIESDVYNKKKIQMFVVNMTFISSREVKKCIFHSCLRHSWNIHFFHFTRWNKSHIHSKHLNILFIFFTFQLLLSQTTVTSSWKLWSLGVWDNESPVYYRGNMGCTWKPTIRLVRPANIPMNLRIRAVWSDYLLIACAFYIVQPPGYPKRDKREPLPHWMNVQANLSLCWLHRSYCRIYRTLHHENMPI